MAPTSRNTGKETRKKVLSFAQCKVQDPFYLPFPGQEQAARSFDFAALQIARTSTTVMLSLPPRCMAALYRVSALDFMGALPDR